MDARLCSGFFLDADWTLCYVCIYWINFSSGSGSCEDCARLARIACLGMNSELGSETSRWIGQMAGFFQCRRADVRSNPGNLRGSMGCR